MLIAIDPGALNVGWSAWDGTKLVSCGLLSAIAKRHDEAALELARCACTHILEVAPRPTTLVVEQMKVYAGRKQVGDPSDLIDCAFVGGCIVGALNPMHLLLPTGHAWKGGLPKTIVHNRLRESATVTDLKILEKSLERVKKSLQHNVLDAVALGFWACHRPSSMLYYTQ